MYEMTSSESTFGEIILGDFKFERITSFTLPSSSLNSQNKINVEIDRKFIMLYNRA